MTERNRNGRTATVSALVDRYYEVTAGPTAFERPEGMSEAECEREAIEICQRLSTMTCENGGDAASLLNFVIIEMVQENRRIRQSHYLLPPEQWSSASGLSRVIGEHVEVLSLWETLIRSAYAYLVANDAHAVPPRML